jgi:5-methylcytosine-specific restriction endonuclease McrA
MLQPMLGTVRPAVAYLPKGEAETDKRRDAQPWRQWYKTARWQRLRWATLVRDAFTCQMCGKLGLVSSKLVADHRRPHRGVEALFWDGDNLQTLCKSPCHDKHKQRMEQGF